jgi:hypothetical protein
VFALSMTNDVFGVLRQQSASTLWWTYFFGAMWGFGGLTFGLTMRYLGISLGMSMLSSRGSTRPRFNASARLASPSSIFFSILLRLAHGRWRVSRRPTLGAVD